MTNYLVVSLAGTGRIVSADLFDFEDDAAAIRKGEAQISDNTADGVEVWRQG